MALTYGFYNSVEGDRTYDAIQMGQIFDGIITDGVYATFLKAMVVKASDNPSEVIVQPGRCWFNHTWTYIDADYPVTAPAPEVILDRVDALVLDINSENAFRANSLVWVQGTPSSLNPERPTLIKSVTHNQYPLCYVYRKAGTTMIYAADITNAVGTSETPFVTGVLTGINIDDLLAQWDDEFHTWETATKTSFEAWMVNQQSVYVTWFDSIKGQMEDDLTGFEAWFETIRGIIDEEAATHLQAEIDELKDMLPAGSHIDISTNEPTLFNRNVTVSDGVHSKTVQFNAIGGATVESFPYIGIIDVSSTDGERIASESLNIPYFGRYSVALAFWSATVNLVGDETLAGLTVTVRDGNGDVVAIVTLNGSGQGVFTATGPDTYKFIYTYGGQTMEVSLAVTQETTYEVEIHGGLNYQAWLDAGRVSESFSSLDEILEDEPTLRQLFLVHDSVDYICDTFSSGSVADVTKIFNTDLAAKWINLSDYALDHFYAVPEIKSIMDTADKYGYGEWALMPQVPKMTSNTAPIGEVSASSEGGESASGKAYKAFDGDTTTGWVTSNQAVSASNIWIRYDFLNPICVKQFEIALFSNVATMTVKVQGSNTGNNDDWHDCSDEIIGNSTLWSAENRTKISISNTEFYSKYRLLIVSETNNSSMACGRIITLQFYAWGPKGNVPVMTSNNAPYGAASADSAYSGTSSYMAFDDDENTKWVTNTASSGEGPYIRYAFVNPTCVKRVYIDFRSANTYSSVITYKVQASNDGSSWVDLTENQTVTIVGSDAHIPVTLNIDNDNYYLYYRVYKISASASDNNRLAMFTLQFYGRELKVSVPTMTSNTAPYGEAIYSTYVPDNSSGYAWNAFDNNNSTYWHNNINVAPDNISDSWIGYKFGIKIVPKMLVYSSRHHGGTSRIPSSIKLQGSDDYSTWTDIEDFTPTSAGSTLQYFSVTDNISYKALRVILVNGNDRNKDVQTLQFYGLDYSEKEFEAGTTKKWLYDHGVELEEIVNAKDDGWSTPATSGNPYTWGPDIIKESNDIIIQSIANITLTTAATKNAFDITNYSKVCVRASAPYLYANPGNVFINTTKIASGLSSAFLQVGDTLSVLDVSSVNQSCYVAMNSANGNRDQILKELWLE